MDILPNNGVVNNLCEPHVSDDSGENLLSKQPGAKGKNLLSKQTGRRSSDAVHFLKYDNTKEGVNHDGNTRTNLDPTTITLKSGCCGVDTATP